jgi:hypothetical protein
MDLLSKRDIYYSGANIPSLFAILNQCINSTATLLSFNVVLLCGLFLSNFPTKINFYAFLIFPVK